MTANDRRPHVLVTDAHATGALAVARSLGARGMAVTVLAEQGRSNLAGRSRYVSRVVTCPPADREPLLFLRAVQEELRHERYDLLIPITDTTIAIVSRHRDDFERLTRVALPPNDVLRSAVDKYATVRATQSCDVAAPRTWTFASLAEMEAAAEQLPYPCVIKPRFSRYWNGTGPVVKGGVTYAHSAEQLRETYKFCRVAPELLLVQEMVGGTGLGVFVLADKGQPLTVFAHRRLREANPLGGRASLAESIALDDRFVQPALRLIQALRWTGVAMVEFKDPGPPAPPFVMEVNGRFWGSLPLAIAAGVDFPALLAQLLLGNERSQQVSYRVGVRCRHLKGDISYLVAALKGRPRDWKGPYPRRLQALASVLPWPGRWRPYNFQLGDPAPALREACDFLLMESKTLAARGRDRAVAVAERGR